MSSEIGQIQTLFKEVVGSLKESLIKLTLIEYSQQNGKINQEEYEQRIQNIDNLTNSYTGQFLNLMKSISEIHEIIFERTLFSKKMKIALEIEEKEKEMALDRMVNGVTTVRGQTRDIVAEIVGLGSGKQYDKAKYVFLNADESIIEQIDNKLISISKAYNYLTQNKGISGHEESD